MKKTLRIFSMVICFGVVCISVPALSQDAYKFELMWGSQGAGNGQFDKPYGITVDNLGNLYVADSGNERIQKFDSNGNFVAKWGSQGAGEAQFLDPGGVAVDSSGNIYVADRGNKRIQKLDPNGVFLTAWDSSGPHDVLFRSPSGVALDSAGNMYVTDTHNHRIQKFDSNRNLVTIWGSQGTGNGEFRFPSGVAVDSLGNVYVADTWNYRIQKFDSNGTFITKWGSYGSEDGQLSSLEGIAVDLSGSVYVADNGNHRIQKFDWNGNLIAKWGSKGDRLFYYPKGVAVDSAGNVYVADYRVQKFDSNGNVIAKWGETGAGNGQFGEPHGIAVASSGHVYVADAGNHLPRVQKFDSSGNFIGKWGSEGAGDGEFVSPRGVAVDSSGKVYVADSGNHRIQEFDSDGNFITKWGSFGYGDGQFEWLVGVSVDPSGNVYVGDLHIGIHSYFFIPGYFRIVRFNSDGDFINNITKSSTCDDPKEACSYGGIAVDDLGNVYRTSKYGYRYSPPTQPRVTKFDSSGNFLTGWPYGTAELQGAAGPVAVDTSGNVFVADFVNSRIQKYDSNGTFVSQWGSAGSANGQFTGSTGIAVDTSGSVYVADWGNNRIQKFSPIETVEEVFAPTTIRGPTDVTTEGSYAYSTSGSFSNLGHPLQYRFDWGDGSYSDWSLSAEAYKPWANAGTSLVRAQGRCSLHTSVESDWSPALTVTISLAPESVSTPSALSGPTHGVTGVTYAYSSTGSQSNLGHPLQYRFDWGDGIQSDWSSSASSSKSWPSPGAYEVRVKARCSTHTTVESEWSGALMVSVRQNIRPDLTGQWVSLVQTCRDTRNGKKCRISGKLTIQNKGYTDAPSSLVGFYLSDNGQYDEGVDTLLKRVATGTIKAGDNKTKLFSYSFPSGETASGKYIIAVIDVDNAVAEVNEINNHVVFGPTP